MDSGLRDLPEEASELLVVTAALAPALFVGRATRGREDAYTERLRPPVARSR